jgi:hypothetical protein
MRSRSENFKPRQHHAPPAFKDDDSPLHAGDKMSVRPGTIPDQVRGGTRLQLPDLITLRLQHCNETAPADQVQCADGDEVHLVPGEEDLDL